MIRKYWWLLILPVLLILWWALNQRAAKVTVHTAAVEQRRIESTVPTNGKVDPADWAAARTEVEGTVRDVLVTRGQHVNEGDILVTLDATAAKADLATAIARRQEAQAELSVLAQGGKATQLATVNGSLASAQTSVEVARRNYEAEQRLFNQQAATRQAVQDAKDTLDRATQQVASFQQQLNSLATQSDRSVAQAKLRDAEAAVALAQHHTASAVIRSPLSGTLYQFDLKRGAYLQIGDLVAHVGNLSQMKIAVYVDEPDLGRISLGIPVTITWDAHPGQKWVGRVDKLPTEVITLQNRNVGEVSTLVDNPRQDLLPGVTVNATVISKVVDGALVIPKAALRTVGSKQGAFRVQKDALEWTPVETGISDINSVQITSGLKSGDLVVDRVVEPADTELKNQMRVQLSTE